MSSSDSKLQCCQCGGTITKGKLCKDCSTVKIYIWSMNNPLDGGEWGHASLFVPYGQTYVSWWPRDGADFKSKKAKQEGQAAPDLNGDIRSENNREPCEYTILMKYENQRKIKIWWDRFKTDGKYCAIGMNCAKTVVTALKEGGQKFKPASDDKGIWTPDDIMHHMC